MAEFLNAREFISRQGILGVTLAVQPGAVPEAPVAFGAPVIDAAFRLENTVFAAMQLARRNQYEEKPGYSAFDVDQEDISGFPSYVFEGSLSPGETAQRKLQYTQEVRDRQLLVNAGLSGWLAMVAAGIIDPINLVPVGQAFGLGRAGIALTRASLVSRSIGAGLAAGATAEAVLGSAQFERTPEEIITNVLFAGAFGGLVGGVSVGISKVLKEVAQVDAGTAAKGESVGARAYELTREMIRERLPRSTDEVSEIVNEALLISTKEAGANYGVRVPKGLPGRVARKLIATHPINRLVSESVPEVQVVARRTVESPLLHEGDLAIQSHETAVHLANSEYSLLLSEMDGDLAAMRSSSKGAGHASKVSEKDWWLLVGDAVRNDAKLDGPWDPALKGSVQTAARRQLDLQDKTGAEAVASGAVRDLGLKGTAPTYMMRIWDRALVAQDVVDGRSLRQEIRELVRSNGSIEVESDMRIIIEHLESGKIFTNGAVSLRDVKGLSSPMHAREILLTDAQLKPWLLNDPRDVLMVFARKVLPEIEFGKQTSAQSPAYFRLRGDLKKASKAAREGDASLLVDHHEDAQNLQTAGVWDVTRKADHALRARFVDGRISLVKGLRPQIRTLRLEIRARKKGGTPPGFVEFGEPVSTSSLQAKAKALQNDLDFYREQLAAERKDAHAHLQILEDSKTVPMSLEVSFLKRVPLKEEAITRLAHRAEGTTFDTMNMEFRRNVDQMGFVHPTEGVVAQGFEREVIAAEKTIADPKKRAKALRKISARKKRAISLLRSMRDIVQNRMGDMFKEPERWALTLDVARGVRTFNFMTDMPQVLFSSLPDVANTYMVAGGKSYAAALKFRMEKGIVSMVRNTEAPLLARQLASMEHVMLGSKTAMQFDMFQAGMSAGMPNQVLNRLSNRFAKATGINWWNSQMRGNTATSVISRIVDDARAMVRGEELSKSQVQDLIGVGITEDGAKRIVTMWEAHKAPGDTGKVGDQRMPHSEAWEDKGIARIFDIAVTGEARKAPLIPSAGGIPILMHNEIVKTFTQFKQFFIESTNRVLFLGVQRGLYLKDANMLIGFTLMTGMGMAVYAIKETMAGRELSEDPAVWAFEGIDRSGYLGMVMEMNNMLERGFGYGIGQAVAGAPASRFASRGVMDALLGPTVGTVEDTQAVLRDALTGTITQSTTNKVQRLTPFANLFYVKWLFSDRFRGAFDDFLDLPKSRRELQSDNAGRSPIRF